MRDDLVRQLTDAKNRGEPRNNPSLRDSPSSRSLIRDRLPLEPGAILSTIGASCQLWVAGGLRRCWKSE
ncbi:MAG: hypothetical protein R2705_25515 [Ilumatobacteraceae bacterium]